MRLSTIKNRVLLSTLVFFLGCDKAPVEIQYIVPDGYTGTLKVLAFQVNGAEARPKNNTLAIRFDTNGVAKLNGPLPFSSWHYIEAKTVSGTMIPVSTTPESVPPETIAVRGAGVSMDYKESWDEIGSLSNVINTRKQLNQKMSKIK